MQITVSEILSLLKSKRFDVSDEKRLQDSINAAIVIMIGETLVHKEYILDKTNRIDFLVEGAIGIEVKIKGSKRDIYRQCERYCEFEILKELILVTNKSMGLPSKINGKNCYILKLGLAWL